MCFKILTHDISIMCDFLIIELFLQGLLYQILCQIHVFEGTL